MTNKDLEILNKMWELGSKLNMDYITFFTLQEEIKKRIDLVNKNIK